MKCSGGRSAAVLRVAFNPTYMASPAISMEETEAGGKAFAPALQGESANGNAGGDHLLLNEQASSSTTGHARGIQRVSLENISLDHKELDNVSSRENGRAGTGLSRFELRRAVILRLSTVRTHRQMRAALLNDPRPLADGFESRTSLCSSRTGFIRGHTIHWRTYSTMSYWERRKAEHGSKKQRKSSGLYKVHLR